MSLVVVTFCISGQSLQALVELCPRGAWEHHAVVLSAVTCHLDPPVQTDVEEVGSYLLCGACCSWTAYCHLLLFAWHHSAVYNQRPQAVPPIWLRRSALCDHTNILRVRGFVDSLVPSTCVYIYIC